MEGSKDYYSPEAGQARLHQAKGFQANPEVGTIYCMDHFDSA
jgi:hypothetical protein